MFGTTGTAMPGLTLLFYEEIERELIESDDIKYHSPKPGRKDVPPLAKDSIKAGASPLKEAMVPRYAKCHRTRLRRHAQPAEEVEEVCC